MCFCDNEDDTVMMTVMNIMMMVMKFSCSLQAGPNDSADAEAAKSKGLSTFFLQNTILHQGEF